MTYQEIESLAKSLSYRDKLHLAQSMLQMARKEEEEQNSSTAKFAAEFPNIVSGLKNLSQLKGVFKQFYQGYVQFSRWVY